MPDFPRLLVTGRNGQVGGYLADLNWADFETVFADRKRLDLSNPESVRRAVRDLAPDVIINAAAYTAVDRAEAEPELAYAINREAPGVMAEELARRVA